MLANGWQTSLVDQVTRRGSGHTPSKQYPEYWDGGVKWISLADSSSLDSGEIYDTAKHISAAGIANSSAVLHPAGTVVLSRDAGVGKSGIMGDDMAVSQHFIAWRCDGPGEIHNRFLYYWLQLRKPFFERMAVGSTIKTIGLPLFKKLAISYPPYEQQKKIADILSTWDKAIETTEKLLVNAEAQKLALMQQLLTGKRRMKGFVAPWRTCHLADVAQIIVSNVDKKSAEGERSVRLCNYMDVYSNETVDPSLPLMQATATPAQIAKFGLRVGDVLITKDSETPEDIAVPAYVSVTADDLVCGYHLAIIRPRAGVLGRFLKFYFEHPHTRYYFASRANGATRFGLTIASIEEAPINLPGPEEQERIADAIAAAEVEVKRALEAIEFLRSEKRALMQQLLTGKRRVTV